MMHTEQLIETIFITGLFSCYLVLWLVKRKHEIQRTGIDPKVLAKATTPVQVYFAKLIAAFTLGVVLMIALHCFGSMEWAMISRVDALEYVGVDIAGVAIGALGLGICLLAQLTMGRAWRVGIDNEHRTKLITHGIFRRIRNPTYLGLFILNSGVWLIWPTAFVASYALLFFVVMEIQVRCEEEYLLNLHGEAYCAYTARTHRYLPWVY